MVIDSLPVAVFLFFFFFFLNCVVTVNMCLCGLQKLKEFLEGRTLITKLEAKRDLIDKTLGESEWSRRRRLHISLTLSLCFPSA